MSAALSTVQHFCQTGKHICIRCLGTIDCEEYFENDHMHFVCSEEFEQYPMSSPSHFKSFRPLDRIREDDTGLASSEESASPETWEVLETVTEEAYMTMGAYEEIERYLAFSEEIVND